LDYTCAHGGNDNCITDFDIQHNGNFMCLSGQNSLEIAEMYCESQNCDTIIFDGNQYASARRTRQGQGCKVPPTIKNKLQYLTPSPSTSNDFTVQNSYGCATGQNTCISDADIQINGNLLCQTTQSTFEEAKLLCITNSDSCDGIISNGQRYEAVYLTTSAMACPLSHNIADSVIFQKINSRRNKRSESDIIQIKRTINDHDVKPFNQIETHFKSANVSVFNVGAHLEYSKNYFIIFHNQKKMIGVLPNKCFLMFQKETFDVNNDDTTPVFKKNTKTTILNVQFVPSNNDIFDNEFVMPFCKGKIHEEEDFLVNNVDQKDNFQITESDKISRDSSISSRSKRHTVECSANRCDRNRMVAQCNRRDCTSGASCLYMPLGIGTQMVAFNHISIMGMWCMPCCLSRSSSRYFHKMPMCTDILTEDKLCNWYKSKGRCGDGRWN